MRWARMAMSALVVCGLAASEARAQRGVGGPDGIAQRALLPVVVTLKGTVIQVETGPCDNTTGRSILGTHFLMKGPKSKTFNMHLGPTAIVEFVAKELTEGKTVKVEAFRTEKMKKNHYVACTITCDGRAVTLRDAALRPAWAGAGSTPRGQNWSANGSRRGMGAGRGRGGYGAGWGQSRGRGGRGWGQGQGERGYQASQCPRFGVWYPVQEPKLDAK